MLLTSCAIATPSAAKTVTPLKPPVITETFSHLPCNQQTTIGLEGCAEARLIKADGRINREVQLLFTLSSSRAQQRSLVKAEAAWFAFRGADCSSQASAYAGGTLKPVEYGRCEVSDDAARTTSLHSYFLTIKQDRSPVPAWP